MNIVSTFRALNRFAFRPSLCAKNAASSNPHPDVFVNDAESYRKGLRLHRFGFRDNLPKRAPLTRDPEEKKPICTLSEYRVKNAWIPKRAYFGQNDYIDILGDGNVRPTDNMKGVPAWLRGFQGNEYQMLLLKRQQFQHWRVLRPTKYHDMSKRIKFLYVRLNKKTPN